VCVRLRGFRALSGRSGNDEEQRCELHELVRDSFYFEPVMSIFMDENFEGPAASRRVARDLKRGGGRFRDAEAIVALNELKRVYRLKNGFLSLVRAQNLA
jgi:hypothetical protein